MTAIAKRPAGLVKLIRKPSAAAEQCEKMRKNPDGFAECQGLVDDLRKLYARVGVGFGTEHGTLNAAIENSRKKLELALNKTGIGIQEMLRAYYGRLAPAHFRERDERRMPYLFPIRIDRQSEHVAAKYFARESPIRGEYSLVHDLILPAAWPAVFASAYSDLAAGMLDDETLTYIHRDPYYAAREARVRSLTVEFKSVIPSENLAEIWRASALVGTPRLFVVVDCTGIKAETVQSVSPDGDPVVVAVWNDEIFHVTDFDTTDAERDLALSTRRLT